MAYKKQLVDINLNKNFIQQGGFVVVNSSKGLFDIPSVGSNDNGYKGTFIGETVQYDFAMYIWDGTKWVSKSGKGATLDILLNNGDGKYLSYDPGKSDKTIRITGSDTVTIKAETTSDSVIISLSSPKLTLDAVTLSDSSKLDIVDTEGSESAKFTLGGKYMIKAVNVENHKITFTERALPTLGVTYSPNTGLSGLNEVRNESGYVLAAVTASMDDDNNYTITYEGIDVIGNAGAVATTSIIANEDKKITLLGNSGVSSSLHEKAGYITPYQNSDIYIDSTDWTLHGVTISAEDIKIKIDEPDTKENSDKITYLTTESSVESHLNEVRYNIARLKNTVDSIVDIDISGGLGFINAFSDMSTLVANYNAEVERHKEDQDPEHKQHELGKGWMFVYNGTTTLEFDTATGGAIIPEGSSKKIDKGDLIIATENTDDITKQKWVVIQANVDTENTFDANDITVTDGLSIDTSVAPQHVTISLSFSQTENKTFVTNVTTNSGTLVFTRDDVRVDKHNLSTDADLGNNGIKFVNELTINGLTVSTTVSTLKYATYVDSTDGDFITGYTISDTDGNITMTFSTNKLYIENGGPAFSGILNSLTVSGHTISFTTTSDLSIENLTVSYLTVSGTISVTGKGDGNLIENMNVDKVDGLHAKEVAHQYWTESKTTANTSSTDDWGNEVENSSVTVNMTEHKCGTHPMVQVYSGKEVIEARIEVDNGNVTVTVNGGATELNINLIGANPYINGEAKEPAGE